MPSDAADEYIKSVYDGIFYLVYAGHFGSIREIYNLPIKVRTYFVKKLSDQLEKEQEQIDKAGKK